MERNEKDELRERLLRGVGKEPSYEEKKRLRESMRAKHAERQRKRPRGREWDEEDTGLEPMAATHGRRDAVQPHELAVDDDVLGEEALVVGVARTSVRVRTSSGEIDALVSARDGSVVVGDLAVIDRVDARTANVRAIRSRRTRLSRPDPGDPQRERVIAANVDIAVVVASASEPPYKPAFVDRMLVAVQFGGVAPVVCINKVDLAVAGEDLRTLELARESMRALGVSIVLASASDRTGLDELRALLNGTRCVFVGHSGVGKSSLANALDPEGSRATGHVRDSDGRGRHTTTGSSLRETWPGTEIVDTPGVRQFGLWGIDQASLAAYFPDFTEAASGCRFRDCTHLVEPECGVKRAVDDGRVAASRLAVYARLRAELCDR